MPCTYTVSFEKRVDGASTPFGDPQTFQVESLGFQTLKAADAKELLAFQKRTARLQRAVLGAEAGRIERELEALLIGLRGDSVMSGPNEPTALATVDRVRGLRHRADARRERPPGPRGNDGEGGRALDPGPHPDLDEGVAS